MKEVVKGEGIRGMDSGLLGLHMKCVRVCRHVV